MIFDIILALILVAFLVFPISAYLVMKFGTAGYYRAKQREDERRKQAAKSILE